MRRIALLTLLILAVGAVAADAQSRPSRPGQPVSGGPECPNGETGFETPEDCEAALVEQGWTKGADGRWSPPPGYVGGDGVGDGSGTGGRTLSLAKSVRLKRLLKSGVKLTLRLPSSGMAVKARLLLKGRTVGSATSTRLSAGKDTLKVRLSKKGKRTLKRALAKRKKVKLTVKVAASGTGATEALVVKR